MTQSSMHTLDANEAVAHVAFHLSELFCIYPITPSSPMAELVDEWASAGKTNIWGSTPQVIEMQSEGGAAGALHGALQGGVLASTFTASQGLLLMIPNMFKIAGELTPTVFHVAARTVATHALSIFGDHSDVMAARSTGFALLASNSVQEAADLAVIAHIATLETRIPFLHFFDGFRTSHEVSKIFLPSLETLTAMTALLPIQKHRDRALTPDRPHIRGTSQNPDVFFQSREAINPYYQAVPLKVQAIMDRYADLTHRAYHLFDYHGHPTPDRILILMGSGAEAVHETVDALNQQGEKVGVLKVRLFLPFSAPHFIQALPPTIKSIAVLDRTKEPGALGEPLYQQVLAAFYESPESGPHPMPKIIGGRYGLSSKEFTPAMIKGIFDHLNHAVLKNHFTIGIQDDVSHSSLSYDPSFSTEAPQTCRAIFYGLGSDGTVGANKNSIKIIGEYTDHWAQGYFVYDSKKSGAMTISHLRFGPSPIHSSYLITQANFIGCHQPQFVHQYDLLSSLSDQGIFLLNSSEAPHSIWNTLPRTVQKQLQDKHAKFYIIDAYQLAKESGMGSRINTIMQTCFFYISNILPPDQALNAIRQSIKKTYQKKGATVVESNLHVVDQTLTHLHQIPIEGLPLNGSESIALLTSQAPSWVKAMLEPIAEGKGDLLPVSAFPVDGTFLTGTTQYEKRNLAKEIPVWTPSLCIQCARCALVCPHAAIRVNAFDLAAMAPAPSTFKYMPANHRSWKNLSFSVQVAPEDCTGCGLCVDICPGHERKNPALKALLLADQAPLVEQEKINYAYFLTLPSPDPATLNPRLVMHQETLAPYFEFSGACAGCGETPYIKLASQLSGDRMIVANATGCSSIYGGNLPTTPWTMNAHGKGPAWANSLFEDNAEFGLGIRLSLNHLQTRALKLLEMSDAVLGPDLAPAIRSTNQSTPSGIHLQQQHVEALKQKLSNASDPQSHELLQLADYLIHKDVWIIGGDGWAYDIGYGGLDHVLASGANVKILVLDTEVYSNTGGQMSKATPFLAVARFAASGKKHSKKDLGLLALHYHHVYIASIAMGANDAQTLWAFQEALSYPGPALIIAYSHCIAHGIAMEQGLQLQKLAVQTGEWILYRYDPRLQALGKNPFQLDSPPPHVPLEEYLKREDRFRRFLEAHPEDAASLIAQAQNEVNSRFRYYQSLAHISNPTLIPEKAYHV